MIDPAKYVRRLPVLAALSLAIMAFGCGEDHDVVEEHRRLSLRLEHALPRNVRADEDLELHANISSSLEGSKIEAWIRILADDDPDQLKAERIPLDVAEDGTAVATLPGRPRGDQIRYVIEARDAAGLVVSLPRRANEGRHYTLRFEGESSRILGGISFLSAALGAILFLGAGAAASQNLRARMSAGPAGMLGGFAVALVVLGLFLLGGIHARQLTGEFWPSSPLFLALTRRDLGIISLIWAGNLFFGKNALLDQEPDSGLRGERGFSTVALIAAGLLLVFILF